MKTLFIYLDDIRDMPWQYTLHVDKAIVCRSYNAAVAMIKKYLPSFDNLIVDLDHDLGYDPTGYDFCKYLVENEITGKFHIHSMNAVGAENMRQLLSHYGWVEF